MIGEIKILCISIITLVGCVCSKDKDEKYSHPMAWKKFREQIHCGMNTDTFFDYCDKNGWKGVKGLTGYSSRTFNKVNNGGEVIQDTFMVRTRIIIGSAIDSVKLIVEMTDSSGNWIVSQIWVTNKELDELRSDIKQITRQKSICEELKEQGKK